MDSNCCIAKRKELFLEGLSPRAGALLAAAIADILSDGFNIAQINALGSFITTIGDAMVYIASQKELNTAGISEDRTVPPD